MGRNHFCTHSFASLLLTSISVGLTQLNGASGAVCSAAINAGSDRNVFEADFWKNTRMTTFDYGERILHNIPGWSGGFKDALIASTKKILSTNSSEFKAIEKLAEIIRSQFDETSIDRLHHVSDKVIHEVLATDYINHVEKHLVQLRYSSKYMLADVGTPQQITSTRAFLHLCRQYLPWQTMLNMRGIVEMCTKAGRRQKRFADNSTSGGKALKFDHLRQSCMLVLAYKHQYCPSAAINDVLYTFRSHSTELVMYGHMCATLEYGENGINSSDFRQVVEHARETNTLMLKWIRKRLKKAWTDDMPKKAEAILRLSEAEKIPKEEYQQVAEGIKESMDAMGPKEYRHNVFLVCHTLSAKSMEEPEFRSVRYVVHSGYNSERFTVKNVKGVDVLVSRYKVGDAERARASLQLVSRRLSEAQKLVDGFRDLTTRSTRLAAVRAHHFYHNAYHSRVHIYIWAIDHSRRHTCDEIKERKEFVYAVGTIASPLCAGGKCPTHYEVASTPARINTRLGSQIRCSYLLLFL